MPYSPTMLVHILGGTIGLLSGTAAMVFRKGSQRHILAGRIFVVSMLTMAAGAVALGIARNQPNNIGGGILTFYLIGTAWLTAKRGEQETSRFDWVAMLIPLTVGALNWNTGVRATLRSEYFLAGVPVGMIFFMGTISLLAAAGDVRMLVRGGVPGTARIARHLWRMCFGLFIASGSFFLGPNNRPRRLLSNVGIGQHISPAFFSLSLYLILTILPLVLLVFWLIRIRFRNAYHGQPQRSSV